MSFLPWGHVGQSSPGSFIKQHDTMLVLGDSLTAQGWYVPLQALVAAAVDETGATMSVTWSITGVPGASTPDFSAGVGNGSVVVTGVQSIIIELGRNDVFQPTLAAETAAALLLIDNVRARNPGVRMCWVGCVWSNETWAQTGVNPPTWASNPLVDGIVNPGIRLACAMRGIQYIDSRYYALQSEPEYNPTKAVSGGLTVDGTHPNATGQAVMSQGVFNQLSFHS